MIFNKTKNSIQNNNSHINTNNEKISKELNMINKILQLHNEPQIEENKNLKKFDKMKEFTQFIQLNELYDYEEIKHISMNKAEKDKKIKELEKMEKKSNYRVIVITSGKGGVGKTTTTANLGMAIAQLGYNIALIDADIGLRNLDLLLGLENRINFTAMDIIDGYCRLDQAIVRDKRRKNLSLLAVSRNHQKYNVTRQHMKQLISALQDVGFQYILIDCPAGIDVGFINAIAPATEAIIVTTPEITAIRDADRVVGLLEANDISDIKLLINRVRIDMIKNNTMLSIDDVREILGIPILGSIPEDKNVIISTNKGEPLVLEEGTTVSGVAFETTTRRLLGIAEEETLTPIDTPAKNFLKKIQEFFLGEFDDNE